MKGDVIVGGLIRKRRELGREIAAHQSEIDRLRLDVAALDQVILVWRPEFDLEAISPLGQATRGVNPGQLSRLILTALRLSSEPLGIIEIARYVMAAEGRSGETVAKHRERVRTSLDTLKERGVVASDWCSDRFVWRIAE